MIHRKSLDTLVSARHIVNGFVSITDPPNRYHNDAIHRSCQPVQEQTFRDEISAREQHAGSKLQRFMHKGGFNFAYATRVQKFLDSVTYTRILHSKNDMQARLLAIPVCRPSSIYIPAAEQVYRAIERSSCHARLSPETRHADCAESRQRRLIGKAGMN